MELKTRITQLVIVPDGTPIFDEQATTISIIDEAGGEFVTITQSRESGETRIDADEWPVIRAGINRMFAEIKKHERKV